MSALVKTKLKAAREAIGKKDWAAAQKAASQVLDYEPENYNANVFLGLAYLELGQNNESEQAYRKAVEASPELPLAWQGLGKFYEKSENWDGYAETLQKLAQIFSNSNDVTKCAETLQRFVELRRQHGSTAQIIEAISLYLHSSPYYPLLSQLPPPDSTNPTATTTFAAQSAIQDSLPIYQEIVDIKEREETKFIEDEVAKRRQRLNAPPPEQIRKDVDREVLVSSELPKLYDEIIGHPNTTDDLRRSTEAKLLRHRLRILQSLSANTDPERKRAAREAVEAQIDGIVLLNIPDEMAWSIHIATRDPSSIEQYDYPLLRRYVSLFPDTPLAKFIIAYFEMSDIPVGEEDDDEKNKNKKPLDSNEVEDKFFDLLDIFSHMSDSILAHRIMAELYIQQENFEDAIKATESGLELAKRSESSTGKAMPNTRKALNIVLGTGLVHFNPPKHHTRALRILADILDQDPDNVLALMGRGYILQRANKYADARTLFTRVAELLPDDTVVGIRAKEEEAWCRVLLNKAAEAEDSLTELAVALDHLEERNEDQARCWYRLGRCLWELGKDGIEEAFKCFITSLKRSPSFAPAFTSLGTYYAEHANPPDPNRASKCFQKAFELDPREAEAARKLAESFAEEREWDLVDVVARRTIEGEGGLESTKTAAAASRYLPTNAWAWKAVGVVELHRHNYAPAITAFQIALRADTEDQLSWLRLGEAYSKAGRFAAALKALARAQELDPEDWMCTYFLGEVYRQTGQFSEAIVSFRYILDSRPEEVGALMALAQSYLDMARAEELSGFEARAEASFMNAIKISLEAIDCSPGFRAMSWKIIADSLFGLSQRSSYVLEDEVRTALQSCHSILGSETSARLSGLFTLGQGLSEDTLRGTAALELALAAYDYRLSLGSKDDHSFSSSWADLALSLHTWGRTAVDADKRVLAEKQALESITEALRANPGSAAYWTILGDIQFARQPKGAQHAFIKALEIDKTNVATWTHLGLLYLHHDDLPLANEALLRAQTLDPDYTLAWVGQAMVATAHKHNADAKALLEHAITLSADVPPADLDYASRLLTQLDAAKGMHSPAAVLPAFFALDRYCRRRSDDACAAHLLGLVYERLEHLVPALSSVTKAINVLEAAYELTEDAFLEQPFAIANASAGRIALSQGNYDRALEAFGSAQGLLPEETDTADSDMIRLRALCQFGSGLARLKLGQSGEALGLLEEAIVTVKDDVEAHTQITVLFAQALWSLGTEDARESAKSQLLQCINVDPENLAAITTLAGMGIVSGDATLVDAALSEILSLPPQRRAELDPSRDVTYLLAQHQLAQGNVDGALEVYREAVEAEPDAHALRRQLVALILQHGEPEDALRATVVETESLEDVREMAAVKAIATSVTGHASAAKKLAHKAVMLTPWASRNWEALAFIDAQPPGEDEEDEDTEAPKAPVATTAA